VNNQLFFNDHIQDRVENEKHKQKEGNIVDGMSQRLFDLHRKAPFACEISIALAQRKKGIMNYELIDG